MRQQVGNAVSRQSFISSIGPSRHEVGGQVGGNVVSGNPATPRKVFDIVATVGNVFPGNPATPRKVFDIVATLKDKLAANITPSMEHAAMVETIVKRGKERAAQSREAQQAQRREKRDFSK